MRNIFWTLFLFTNGLFAQTNNFVVDAIVSPKKQEQIITVGGINANIQDYTNDAIQMAVDALPAEGRTGSPQNAYYYKADPISCSSDEKDNPITFFAFKKRSEFTRNYRLSGYGTKLPNSRNQSDANKCNYSDRY